MCSSIYQALIGNLAFSMKIILFYIYQRKNYIILIFNVLIRRFRYSIERKYSNNKCQLIPFMIRLCLPILGCVGLIILMIIYGFLDAHPHDPYGKIDLLVRMIPICIILGFSIYFLVIIVKFYKELASGIVDGQREGVVLQTFNSPLAPPAGTQVVNASSELEKSSYPPQQYPHEQPQPPIISQSYIQ